MKKLLDSPNIKAAKKKCQFFWLYITGGTAYLGRWLLLKIFTINYEKRINRVTKIHGLLLKVSGLTLIAQVEEDKKMVTLSYVPTEKTKDVPADNAGKS